MSDISIPGISSKYNTNKLIEDLVKAERIPLEQMDKDVKALETEKSTWRQINRELGELQRSVKDLYGFENPFNEKKVVSSNENYLVATAERTASLGKYSVLVKQLATADKFLSPSLPRDFQVDKGEYAFKVGDKSVILRYRGGKMEDFVRRLNEKAKGLVEAFVVRDTAQSQVLMIQAIPTGSMNQLNFEKDALNLAIKTGMMRQGNPTDNFRIEPQQLNLETEDQNVEINEESILVKPSSGLTIPFNQKIELKEGMVIEYSYRTIEIEDEKINPPPPPSPPPAEWPQVPSIEYEGLKVRSEFAEVEMPLTSVAAKRIERFDNNRVFKIVGTKTIMDMPEIAPTEELKTVRINADQLPAEVESILVDNRNTHRSIVLQDIHIFNPKNRGALEPAKPVNVAEDAIIEFGGIEARRSTNNIDDLIDGLVFSLKGESSEPVTLEVKPDIEMAKEGVIRFVFSYNKVMSRLLVLTSGNQDIIDELSYLDDDQIDEYQEQLGSFRGDYSLVKIRNEIQRLVSSPYPTREGVDLTMLAQIGISTNASSGRSGGGSLDFSKLRGYLEIDEEKLDASLSQNIGAISDLFGNDTNNDLIIDTGVAKNLDTFIIPYTQIGGLTAIRMTGLDGKIKEAKEDITDYEKHVEDYEVDLKRKYGNMESILNRLENDSKGLQNFNNQQNRDR